MYLDLRFPLVWTVDHFFSQKECSDFIARIDTLCPTAAPITTASGPKMMSEVRNNSRAMEEAPEFAQALYARILPHVPPVFFDRSLCGVNERFRYYQYDPGQQFKLHLDGSFVRNPHEASELTFLIYLNDDFDGGQTNFPEQKLTIQPKQGSALFFQHRLLHEGAPVLRGRKYVLRTDVMYREER